MNSSSDVHSALVNKRDFCKYCKISLTILQSYTLQYWQKPLLPCSQILHHTAGLLSMELILLGDLIYRSTVPKVLFLPGEAVSLCGGMCSGLPVAASLSFPRIHIVSADKRFINCDSSSSYGDAVSPEAECKQSSCCQFNSSVT